VEDFTKPNTMIYIDLPTYYMPCTGPTEPALTSKPSVWSDIILKYLSGITLIELLTKFGLIRTVVGNLSFTDEMDNAINAYKVFSDIGGTERTNEISLDRKRESRQGKTILTFISTGWPCISWIKRYRVKEEVMTNN
jgi:hypothetical protein